MNKFKRYQSITQSFCTLFWAGLVLCGWHVSAQQDQDNGAIIQTISRVVATQELVVINESPGFIEWVAEVGAEVKQGQTLLKLDASQLNLDLRVINNEQARLKSELSYNEDLLLKTQRLHKKHSISESEVDRLNYVLDQLTLRIKENALKAQLLEKKIARMHVRAPFDGIVVKRNTNAFQYEQEHEALLRFIGNANKELEVAVPAKYLPDINHDSRVSFTSRFGDFELAISAIIPEVLYDDSNIKVRVRLPLMDWVDGEIIYTKILTR
ncbi:HlyD family efflux transporter periplasmic adaptor subunit [Pseudoalteromonas sp. R3]|uniref:efflux RND transporter periplasmic adaptor subunit n=1 Tax=Pseudoalteromonas sp. R3 TaxID=1709477 RepID=UPI0006B4A3DA|nr:HlyD family efflux transporter periplasmic adaptor subunit [Pseudoalteromonas sp. R3]